MNSSLAIFLVTAQAIQICLFTQFVQKYDGNHVVRVAASDSRSTDVNLSLVLLSQVDIQFGIKTKEMYIKLTPMIRTDPNSFNAQFSTQRK